MEGCYLHVTEELAAKCDSNLDVNNCHNSGSKTS